MYNHMKSGWDKIDPFKKQKCIQSNIKRVKMRKDAILASLNKKLRQKLKSIIIT